ncbi:MAG: TIGR02466 family protein [Elainellaceae cyanobacterium]
MTPQKARLSREDTFPTPIWKHSVKGAETLNPALREEIFLERSRDERGMSVSNVSGWHSSDKLHQRPVFRQLFANLNDSIGAIVNELAWDLKQVTPAVISCWAMVSPKNAYSSFHHHPNSVLSGVYYVQTPENCGDLYFHDPRAGGQILLPPVRKSTPWTTGKIRLKPQAGLCVIFPSWFWHGVEPNLSDEIRISISFNIGVRHHATDPN